MIKETCSHIQHSATDGEDVLSHQMNLYNRENQMKATNRTFIQGHSSCFADSSPLPSLPSLENVNFFFTLKRGSVLRVDYCL